MAPLNYILRHVTREYLETLDPAIPPSSSKVEQQLLGYVNLIISAENDKVANSRDRYSTLRSLTVWQVAQILVKLHFIVCIAPSAKDTDREYDLLAMYRARGTARGTYTTSENDIRTAARRYNMQMSLKDFAEVTAILREDAPRVNQCTQRDLVAVNNGIFYYGSEDADLEIGGQSLRFKAKTLHPFDPSIVFLSKSLVNYVENAPQQVITHPVDGTVWDVESWMDELSDEDGMSALLWEVVGAIIRPHVRWGKTAWFYSEKGNNGKGTLCALMRNLVGEGSHTSIPLSDFGKEFALEPLVRANAIIVDENDVGTFIDKAANLKAIVTNDVIQINRKHRVPIAFQFWGLMVQCLNEFPLVKDKSESFYRRQLFVPFLKCFTGKERKYIKDDYLQRQGVLEYVLWYVLNRAGAATPGSYYQLSEPVATNAVLAEYKEYNDPVRSFWDEFHGQFAWDLLPFPFLYDLFKAWFTQVSPSGTIIGRAKFTKDLVQLVASDPVWDCADKNKVVYTGNKMQDPELLIAEYGLKAWYEPSVANTPRPDAVALSRPTNLKPNYRGLTRRDLASLLPAGATTAPSTTTSEES